MTPKDSYDKIDRFLRNNLSDDDYAEYSMSLDHACGIGQITTPSCLNCKHNNYPYSNCDDCEMQKDNPENEGNWESN